jgi:hypothetical protein
MDAVRSYETYANFYRAIWRYVIEDGSLPSRCCDHLKFCVVTNQNYHSLCSDLRSSGSWPEDDSGTEVLIAEIPTLPPPCSGRSRRQAFLSFQPWIWRQYFPPKLRAVSELLSVTTHKAILFGGITVFELNYKHCRNLFFLEFHPPPTPFQPSVGILYFPAEPPFIGRLAPLRSYTRFCSVMTTTESESLSDGFWGSHA